MPMRQKAWDKIASEWKIPWLDRLTSETSLQEVDSKIDLMLQGKHKGRMIVRLWD
ncbi:MAG: oxidoreductase, partial [Deltaproteobacteria bacterium]|nr:oxidoreductase [Deltaproteobacteria bacterium]